MSKRYYLITTKDYTYRERNVQVNDAKEMYFTDKENIHKFLDLGTFMYEITIPDSEKITTVNSDFGKTYYYCNCLRIRKQYNLYSCEALDIIPEEFRDRFMDSLLYNLVFNEQNKLVLDNARFILDNTAKKITDLIEDIIILNSYIEYEERATNILILCELILDEYIDDSEDDGLVLINIYTCALICNDLEIMKIISPRLDGNIISDKDIDKHMYLVKIQIRIHDKYKL
jgi:YHS domain-containing protein